MAFLQTSIKTLRYGFTLIELITVVTVIAVVLSLLMPVMEQVRRKINNTLCRHQLRQWGIATQLYVTHHDGYLPSEGNPNPGPNTTRSGWYELLPHEIGLPGYHLMPWRTNASVKPGRTLWLCPDNTRRSNGRNLFHYCLNQYVNGTGKESQPTRLFSIAHPARVVWLFDSKNLPAVGRWTFMHTNLHGGGAQIVFLDAHVERVKNPPAENGVVRVDTPAELIWIP